MALKYRFTNNSVIFTHNGSEFTTETLFALLYQCSEGKEDNKSIGRFGTGALSATILSRKYHISGDVKTTASGIEKIYSFDVDIDRKGESAEELQKGVENMEESFYKSDKIKGEPSFEYDIDFENDTSAKAYNIGYHSLKNKAPIVLILNNLIESIIIENEKEHETLTYTAKHENDHIQSVIIESNK